MALLEQPQLDRSGWSISEVRRVVARLVDGEVVPVGTAPNLDAARALARSVISEIERPAGEWPLVGDRLLKPEAVLSVDVLSSR